MKRFEIILGIVFLIAVIFKIADWPGGSILATISLTLLTGFYFYFGFAFFNNIRLKNILNGNSYQGISVLRIIGSIGAGWGLAILCLGILFNVQHYPGEKIMLSVGLIAVFVVAIIALIKLFRSKSDFYKMIVLRIGYIGGIGIYFFLMSIW